MAELLMERRISPKAFVGNYILAAAGGIALAAILFTVNRGAWGAFAPVGVLPILVAAGHAYVTRLGGAYRLYEDRLEVETGLLSRKIENVELFRIRDVGLRQGLIGRIADFGDVYVHSTDSSTPAVHVHGIDQPRDFYTLVRQKVSDSRAQHRTMIIEEGREISEP